MQHRTGTVEAAFRVTGMQEAMPKIRNLNHEEHEAKPANKEDRSQETGTFPPHLNVLSKEERGRLVTRNLQTLTYHSNYSNYSNAPVFSP